MSLAELFARLGTSVVLWLCIYAWLIWTATLRVATCNTSGDDLWALVLGFGVFVAGLSPLLALTRTLPEVHAMVRHFAWPLVLLLPLAAAPVWTAWVGSTFAAAPLCAVAPAASWHPWWAPLQSLMLLFTAYHIWRGIR
jgi:hypothetical protein